MSKSNGQQDPLERMRMIVVEQELSARSWKAMVEKMESTIRVSELQSKYDEVVEENQKKLEEQRKQMEEIQKATQEAMAEAGLTPKD